MSERKILRARPMLDAIAGEFELDGVLHPVKKMTWGQQQELEAAGEDLSVIRKIIAELIPSLTPEQLKSLNYDIAQAISVMSNAGVEAVERLFPNAVSPASTTSPG